MITTYRISGQNFEIPLWSGHIPNYQKTDEQEIRDTTNIVRISKVQKPTIAVYLPAGKNVTRKAVVICPGGGYHILAYDWEGIDIAKWLNANGIAAIVLKYRLPTSRSNITPHKSPLIDAQRAMRMVRHHAGDWNIDPEKVGIMGFSAGGHLASTLGTHFDEELFTSDDPIDAISCRPDFMILAYPVITFSKPFMHRGSMEALLGKDAKASMKDHYSNELQVKANVPPTFIVHSGDDKAVPVENSLVFYQALKEKNVPAEMHIYSFGGHGFSLAIDKGHLQTWTQRCIDWLKSLP
ncbi:alpha/beta hydrolase [Fulvivirgaceae bacterium BMA12]|uniref:Alpha/beta hydrolase n=1 Tax=Agaribacillus aureus TaxID=3051825 RepID=A0ABT8LBJ1_9BACT|nr:alpha/beta hydrolase [Fulvivirgaceae bacterium BMA12]